MPKWITQREAAAILGVHPSLIPKLLRRGDLWSRPRMRPSLQREEVEALRARRATPPAPRPGKPRREPTPGPQPPDRTSPWLTSDEAAALMGVTRNAVNDRARRGRLPSLMHDGRRWFRQDHLELVKRADDVKRGRGGPGVPSG